MHKPSSLRDYVIALLIASALTVFLGLYLSFQHGFLFDAPAEVDPWDIPNQAIANAALILLAFTFLIGPIVRYFDRFDTWLGYRKEIGIVGGFLAVSHGVISAYFLPLAVPELEFEGDTIAGLIGAALLVFLFIISFKKAITLIGPDRWWLLQRWGLRLVILLVLIHIFGMQFEDWKEWLIEGGEVSEEIAHPLMAPASLIAGLFILWVTVIRLYETALIFKSCGFIKTKEVCTDIHVQTRGRKFFIRSLWALVIIYILIFTRWMW